MNKYTKLLFDSTPILSTCLHPS